MSAVLKGALVTFLPGSPLASILGFQLNPETIAHTLNATAGAPVETFGFTLVLDQNENFDPGNTTPVASQLMALQALVFPAGQAALPPAVLFAWGRGNLVPVRVNSLDITANGFDSQLNPIQAEVRISLLALTQREIATLDAPMASLAGAAFSALAQARSAALQQAQSLADPDQSSAGGLFSTGPADFG